jgi:hypothetical protein
MKLKRKELKDGDKVFYKAYDDTPGGSSLGHAEFVVCPVYSRGKLKEVFIYHKQQRNIKYYYHFKFPYSPYAWGIESYNTYNDPVNIWRMAWCAEHKCLSLELYVPKYTDYFEIEMSNFFTITFKKSE